MRAVRFENHGGYGELALADVPAPATEARVGGWIVDRSKEGHP